jgi:hypothetical protein
MAIRFPIRAIFVSSGSMAIHPSTQLPIQIQSRQVLGASVHFTVTAHTGAVSELIVSKQTIILVLP